MAPRRQRQNGFARGAVGFQTKAEFGEAFRRQPGQRHFFDHPFFFESRCDDGQTPQHHHPRRAGSRGGTRPALGHRAGKISGLGDFVRGDYRVDRRLLTYNANALHDDIIDTTLEAAMQKIAEILEIPATITARGQTTVPAAIRKMLALGKRDRVVFRGLADGTVIIAKKDLEVERRDPVIDKFLKLLANDMATGADRILALPSDLLSRGMALVEGVECDLDSVLAEDQG